MKAILSRQKSSQIRRLLKLKREKARIKKLDQGNKNDTYTRKTKTFYLMKAKDNINFTKNQKNLQLYPTSHKFKYKNDNKQI